MGWLRFVFSYLIFYVYDGGQEGFQSLDVRDVLKEPLMLRGREIIDPELLALTVRSLDKFLHQQSTMVEELRPNGRRRIGFDVKPALRGSLFELPSHRGVVVGSCAGLRHHLAKWSILDAHLFQADD
jgi:hypothetical protein